jgi:soluble lytic murein transglycosylase-like protein
LLVSAFGSDSPLREAETPAPQPPEVCQAAVPRNGFTIQYLRLEVADPAARLWLGGDPGAGYAEIASARIDGFEQRRSALPLAPPARPSVPDEAVSGDLPVRAPFKNLIASAASRYQIDPDLVASVVKAESGFNPTVVSPKGAQGLMQLMPETAARLGVEDLLDPATNLVAGSKYLRQLLDQFAGDSVKALAAYVAGPERVELYGGILAPETRAYVSRIIDDYNRKKLRRHAHSSAAPAGK